VGTIVNNNLVQPTVEEIIFPAQEAPVEGLNATALLMYDSGSNLSYISLDAVQRIQAKPVKSNISLSLAVLGGKTKNLKTKLYEVKLINQEGKTERVTAYGIDNKTSPLKIPNNAKIAQIFPDIDLQLLYRKSSTVDILIGLDNAHVMPERTVVKTEQGLRIMENTFGIMLQGLMTDSIRSSSRCNVTQIEGSDRVSHGTLRLQVQGNVNACENLDVLQEILPKHYLQSCSGSELGDSSKVSRSVSGTSSSQLSGSQLGLSQVKQEEGEADAEHPTTLLLQTPDISADDNDLQSGDNNQPVIPTTIEIDESNKPLNYEENTAQVFTSFWKCKGFPREPEVKLKEVNPQDSHEQIVFTNPVFVKSQASTARQFYKAKKREIQNATEGNTSKWWWIKSNSNLADWVSRTKSLEQIGPMAEVSNSLKSVNRTELQHILETLVRLVQAKNCLEKLWARKLKIIIVMPSDHRESWRCSSGSRQLQ